MSMPQAALAELLRELDSRDIRFSSIRGRLKLDAPRGALDEALRTKIASHKAELLRHLDARVRRPPVALEPSQRGPRVPASFAQRRLWFQDRLAPGTDHIPLFIELRGPLQLGILRTAINRIIARHEALRTHFADPEGDDEDPLQIIEAELRLELPLIDLRDTSRGDPASRLTELGRELAWSPFDLSTGPLLRGCVVQRAPQDHLLMLTFHHAIFDGWSLSIFLRELSTIYNSEMRDEEPELATVRIQYGDFAVWQRRALVGEPLERLLGYWRTHLADAPSLINLPRDRPRPATQRFVGGRIHRQLDGPTLDALVQLSRSEHVTLVMTLLAGYATLLARHARCEDLVIGVPIAHRDHKSLEGLIGMFASTLAIRLRPAPEQTFVSFLAQVKHVMSEAHAHQALPFERVVEALKVERSLAHHPLFQVTFTYMDAAAEGFALTKLSTELVEFEHERSPTDLGLKVRRFHDRLVFIFEYNSDLFDRSTIERLAENFHALLEGVAEEARVSLRALPLISAVQLDRVLRDFNSTAPENDVELGLDLGDSLHQQFQRQAAERPDTIAVTRGAVSISYGELDRQVNRLARRLVDLGVGPETVVALCLPRSIDIFVAILATLAAGGAYLPLDVEQPKRRLAFMLDDSGVQIVVTSTALCELVPDQPGRRVLVIDAAQERERIRSLSARALEPRGGLDDLAYVIYTSGSTGAPKGVMVSHRAILTTHMGCRAGYHPDMTGVGVSQLQILNPAFDGFTSSWIFALCNGGRLVVCPTEQVADPEALYRLMVAERTCVGLFVPSVTRRLCNYLEQTEQRLDFMSCYIDGADIIYVQDHRRLRELCRPDTQVTNTFGVTEAAVMSTIADHRHIDTGLAADAIAPIGRPIANVRVYVLDEALQPVPIGVLGELCIAGQTLARGYLGRPALTAEKFVEVELPHRRERLYRTGDLARWRPDGVLEFFGRLDHQVKLRGLRIEVGEIEAAMLAHPAVREALVMLHREGDEAMLVAWLVLDGVLADVNTSLRNFLGQRVPRYMVPSAFVTLAALPLTPNGKIDRQALPAPTHDRTHLFTPPRNAVELELSLIWADLLGRSPISVRDDFFALGGDSLLAVRLVSSIERRLGGRVPLQALFGNGTIEQLACVLRRERLEPSVWSPLACLQPRGDKPPLFFVHAAGGIVFRYLQVAALLGDERPFYAIQARGIEPGTAPYPTVKAMAADYVRAIREVQPHGPYLIGGWSFGGTVAFEMARVLADLGESVPLLLMVDAPSPHANDYEEDDIEFLLERLRPAAGLELADVEALDSREQKMLYLIEQQRLAGLLAPDVSVADAQLRLAIHKHHNRLASEYLPGGPCRTKIVFYSPTESIPFDRRMQDPTVAWRQFALDGVEVHEAPGNHFNMFSAENGPVLAEKLRAHIAELD